MARFNFVVAIILSSVVLSEQLECIQKLCIKPARDGADDCFNPMIVPCQDQCTITTLFIPNGKTNITTHGCNSVQDCLNPAKMLEISTSYINKTYPKVFGPPPPLRGVQAECFGCTTPLCNSSPAMQHASMALVLVALIVLLKRL